LKNQNKILGAIFVATGLVNLIHPEYLDFGIFTAIGGGLLLEADESAAKKIVQITLAMIAFVLLIIRLGRILIAEFLSRVNQQHPHRPLVTVKSKNLRAFVKRQQQTHFFHHHAPQIVRSRMVAISSLKDRRSVFSRSLFLNFSTSNRSRAASLAASGSSSSCRTGLSADSTIFRHLFYNNR
jgi:hypothetical protein